MWADGLKDEFAVKWKDYCLLLTQLLAPLSKLGHPFNMVRTMVRPVHGPCREGGETKAAELLSEGTAWRTPGKG